MCYKMEVLWNSLWYLLPYIFTTINTTLPANDFQNIFYSLIKMTLTDELRILGDNIKANQAQSR